MPHFAGKLIEEAGLKGFQIGGAQISEMHGNFIVNAGNAKAYDVLQLIEYVKKTIYGKIQCPNGNRSRNNRSKVIEINESKLSMYVV